MKIYKAFQQLIEWIVFILFLFLVTIVLLQIVCRFLHIPQTWIDEISKFTFVWLTYLGGCITVSRGMNITFDLFLEGAKGQKFKVLFTIVNVFCLIFLIAGFVLTAKSSWLNRGQKSPMTGLNMALVNAAMPIGFLLMIFAQIAYYFRRLKNRPQEEKEEEERLAAEAKGGDLA